MKKIKTYNIHFFEFFLPLFCFLAQYDFVVSNIAYVIILVYLLFRLRKRQFIINKYFGILLILSILVKLVQLCFVGLNYMNYITSLFDVFFLVIIIGLSNFKINLKRLTIWYTIFALIASVFIVIQSYYVYILGQTVNPIILFNVSNTATWFMNSTRPMGLFKEPQLYCTFMFPLIILLLYYKKYILTGFFCLTILLSGSTTGIILLLIIFMVYLLRSNIRLSNKIAIFLIVIISIITVVNLPIFEASINKLLSIGDNNSDFSRLLKSYYTYIELPFKNQIIGIGEHNLLDFIKQNNYYFSWMSKITETSSVYGYQTSLFGVFVENGFIFAILYYCILVLIYRNLCNSKLSKSLLLILVIQSISSLFYFNYAFYFYFLLIFCIEGSLEKEKEIQEVVYE